MNHKETREGFEVDADLVGKFNGRIWRQPFPIKVNSLNYDDIQPVIDYWRNSLKEKNDPRKIVVKDIYRVEKVSRFKENP